MNFLLIILAGALLAAACVSPNQGLPVGPPDGDVNVMVEPDGSASPTPDVLAPDAPAGQQPEAGGPDEATTTSSIDVALAVDLYAGDLPPGLRMTGLPCSQANECVSGYCVDGVCCSSECKGTCVACSAAKNKKADGTCASVPAGEDPDTDCAADMPNGCGNDGTCDGAGACRKRVAGTTCGTASCDAGKFAAAPACDGKGTCAPASSSSCGSYGCTASGCRTTCTGNGDCAAGVTCVDGKCGGKRANGAGCGSATECGSNLCVDGVCCDRACNGTCEACARAKTGAADGVCAPIRDGDDPDSECNADGSACGTDGWCNGAGACRVAVAGKTCGTSCSGSTLVTSTCDGKGSCAGTANTSSCGLYTCNGNNCGTSCSSGGQCASNAYCNGSSCAIKKSQGAGCSNGLECGSGACVDGVCCSDSCSGTCMACNVSGHIGTCYPVPSGALDSACVAQSASSCGTDGTCDGSGSCRKYQSGTMCSSATCSSGKAVPAGTCNGNGTCVVPTSIACAPFACSGSACVTSCNGNGDCDATHICNTTSHTCVNPPRWVTYGQIVGSSNDDGSTVPSGQCSPVNSSFNLHRADAPNGAQWGHVHEPAKDSMCPTGQWMYLDAVHDCSGSPEVVQDSMWSGGRACYSSSNGQKFWDNPQMCPMPWGTAPGPTSLLHITQIYYCN